MRLSPTLRNKGTELDIREQLTKQGFEGKYAKFSYVELAAVQRPGWRQLFRFHVKVTDPHDERKELFGVAMDDERKGIEIVLTESEDEQKQYLDAWSDGMITRRRPGSPVGGIMIFVFLVMLLAALIGALRTSF